MITQDMQTAYLSILREELVPATGCTEPIALAYAAARLRELLGAMPERIDADISGNIIKNVKSVVVPNTGGKKGIPAAIAAGIVAGDAGKVLQVIAHVPPELHAAIGEYVENTPIRLTCSHTYPAAGHRLKRLRRGTHRPGADRQQPLEHRPGGAGRGSLAGKALLRLRRGQPHRQERPLRGGYSGVRQHRGPVPHWGPAGGPALLQPGHRRGGPAQRLGRQRGFGDSGRVPGQPQVRRQGLGPPPAATPA